MSTLRSRAALVLTLCAVAALLVAAAGSPAASPPRPIATAAGISCPKDEAASRTACLKLQQAFRACAKQKGSKRKSCEGRVRALARCQKKHGKARLRCQREALAAGHRATVR
jgi:hypothetical protein